MAYNKRRKTDLRSSLGERVSALEQAVEHIDNGMSNVRHSMETLRKDISSEFATLYEKLDNQNEKLRPHILGWAGWAAVILIILGMVGRGYVRDIERIEQNLSKLEANRISAQDPVQNKELSILDSRLSDIRFSILREMDQKMQVVSDRVNALDEDITELKHEYTKFKQDIVVKTSKNTAFIDELRTIK